MELLAEAESVMYTDDFVRVAAMHNDGPLTDAIIRKAEEMGVNTLLVDESYQCRSVLYWFISFGRLDAVVRLLALGAEPNIYMLSGESLENYSDPMTKLIKRIYNVDRSMLSDCVDVLNALLDHGYKVAFPAEDGGETTTLFRMLASVRNPVVLLALEAKGVLISQYDEIENNPESPLFELFAGRGDPVSIETAFRMGMRVTTGGRFGLSESEVKNPSYIANSIIQGYTPETREAVFNGMMKYQCNYRIPISALPGWTINLEAITKQRDSLTNE